MEKYKSWAGEISYIAEPPSQECRDKATLIADENTDALFDWYDEFFSIIPGYPIDRESSENKKHALQQLKICKAY